MAVHIVRIEGIAFPLRSAKRGRCPRPEAIVAGVAYCPRSPNNVLMIDPPADLHAAVPGWRRVGARPRWNLIDGAWRANDGSLQRLGQHRWWGRRDHVRLWRSPSGRHAIGQAHTEDWHGWPRRHRVLGLDAARDALARSLAPISVLGRGTRTAGGAQAEVSWFDTGLPAAGHDGRVLVVRF